MEMNAITIASLSLIVFAQAVNGYNLYGYTRKCKDNTELCINLKCSASQSFSARVPFTYNYACCNGKLYDEMNYACVHYQYLDGSSRTVVEKCDPCTQFKCGGGQCTLKQWKCNNVKNCMDGSDEVGCGRCSDKQFYCRRADQCISASRVCDKVNDCRDGSDEIGCQNERGTKCGTGFYRCKNNQCIDWTRACDGKVDCQDGSDEGGSCGYYNPKSGKKRDEISSFSEKLFKKDGGVGGNAVDAAKGTVVN